MSLKSFKILAIAGTAALALGVVPTNVRAADNANVTASITTSSAITATNGATMDFGHFLIRVRSSETPTIKMASTTGAYTYTGVTNSTIVPLTAATGTPGTALVKLPTGADNTAIQVTLTGITDFAAASNLSVTAVSYSTFTETTDTALPVGTAKIVTTRVGGTNETVNFGATITAALQPPDGTYGATLAVSFNY